MTKSTNPRLAYWDSFAGLIPCRVVRYDAAIDPGYPACVVAVLTATRGCYQRGERIAQDCRNIWPRDCVRAKRGTFGTVKIVAPYDWGARLRA